MPMKNSNGIIGHGTRNLPTCIAVPQPTALPRALVKEKLESKVRKWSCSGAGGNGSVDPCILTFGTRCQDADQYNYTPVPLLLSGWRIQKFERKHPDPRQGKWDSHRHLRFRDALSVLMWRSINSKVYLTQLWCVLKLFSYMFQPR